MSAPVLSGPGIGPEAATWAVVLVFLLVYLGMFLTGCKLLWDGFH